MSGLYGYSADCFEDDCEHCEQPDGCDCDCHLEDLSEWCDDVFVAPSTPRVTTVRVPLLEAPAGEAS